MVESACDVNGYDWVSDKIKEHLGLTKSPVAVKFVLREEDIPESINKIENGKYTKSTNENILKFRDYLNEKGIVATVRRELGSDIDAACGQLRKKEVERCESTQKQI